ncbi:hypothetical protein MMC18_001666 [Xylographa bjoerkii]|nr:hypothetical protein [Xylographa bjoerkii]
MPTLETYHGIYLWRYVPSLPAAITFAILFGLATTAHGWKMVTTRMWFCLPFVIGGIFEEIGYIARAAAFNSTGALSPYILQAIFLLLPPVLFAASLYMVYSRVVRAVQGENFSLISPRRTTVIFVLGDFFCLSIQSDGGGLLIKPNTVHVGDCIIVAGLGLQILMFAGFMMCCLSFNIRFRAHIAKTGATSDIPWQSCLNMLYSTSLAVLVRNIYRVIEFIMGQDGYLLSNEWPTYVFDGALMLLVMIGFFIWYPSQLHPSSRDSMVELATDGASSAEHGRAMKLSEPTL